MNVDTMRRLDYYVGVPLCFLLTISRKVFSFFAAGKTVSRKPENILFIELSEMGSAILADPAMNKLKRQLGASLFFVIFRRNRPSLEFLDTVHPENIFSMRDDNLMAIAADTIRFYFWTRRRRIDTVIDLELFSRFTALLSVVSRADRRVGFSAFHEEGLYRGDFLTHKVIYNPHQHIAKNFVALVNALLNQTVEVPYSKTVIADEEIRLQKVSVPAAAREAMLGKIRDVMPLFDHGRHRLIIFNTNSSELIPLRRWPVERYVALAGLVLDRYQDTVIILTGDAGEGAEKDAMVKAVGERCLNFAGCTALSELTALYAVSSFMVTNDSGPAHFASLTDMPVFVLFGPETPDLYGPLGNATSIYARLACSPCVTATNHRKTVCNDNVCLRGISAEEVFEKIRPLLDHQAP